MPDAVTKEEFAVALERIAALEGELDKARTKTEQLEKVMIRLIGQVEGHQHLPNGKAAMPLGE